MPFGVLVEGGRNVDSDGEDDEEEEEYFVVTGDGVVLQQAAVLQQWKQYSKPKKQFVVVWKEKVL